MADGSIPQERRDFYVYVIFRPNGVPCYVGKGKRHRWRMHANGTHNRGLGGVYKAAGGDLPIVKVREGLTNAEAIETEIALIAVLGRKDRGGLLFNLTDGGEGVLGHTQSEETRAKKRAKLKGRPRPPEAIAKMRLAASNRSPEWRAKQSIAQKGKKIPPEVGAKISAANKGRVVSDKTKALLRDKNKGRKFGPEFSAKLREAFTPERRAAIIAINKGNKYGIGNKRTPEGQAIVTAAVARNNALRVATPEYRELRSKIAKAMWAKRKEAAASK